MGFSSWCAESFCNKKRTESKVRQIVCGLTIFAGVLHFIYVIVAMAGTWDARFQPVRHYLNASAPWAMSDGSMVPSSSLNASSTYVFKPNPAALSTGLMLGLTGTVLIYFGVCMIFEIGGVLYPGITCALNLLASILMIVNISTPKSIYCTSLQVSSCVNRGLQTPIGVGVGWLIVDFVLFVSAGYVCWLERKTCGKRGWTGGLKDGDVKGADTKRVELP